MHYVYSIIKRETREQTVSDIGAGDEPSVLTRTARLLCQQGYTVPTASNGNEALQIARAHTQPFHLLLSDLMLPKLSGTVVAQRLTATLPHLKAVFSSGYPDTTMVQLGRPSPMRTFLPKPFSHPDLAKKVRAT